ncbi:uncharacterized protein MJAP1_003613 [Malassezia japonica]|uniref:Uncharacterized protein n=1 Tax=Malassezia japonica TaxID=223818 RepID=A0AAF0F4E0_9BASI|nr:uncharacterized protein MJAP1_003613 [Malassezia japonica]WFD40625.1 hypothetical protein MJAP1_003613 [Malassezia japonica]
MVANTYVMTILYLTADIAYGKNIFDRGIHHPGFITFMIVFGLGLAVLSVFYALVTSIVLLSSLINK